jgi:hypothetical protein
MKTPFKFLLILGTLLALSTITGVADTIDALPASGLGVAALDGPHVFLEGDPGFATFEVTNLLPVPVRITRIRLFATPLGPDPNDVVSHLRVAFTDCRGRPLQPGGVCKFIESFATDGGFPDRGESGDNFDFGKWELTNTVTGRGKHGVKAFGIGQTIVRVNDTPEPATLALFGSGLLVLAGVVRRRLVKDF